MNPHSSRPPARPLAKSWVFTGLGLIFGGILLLPTVAMTGIGVGLMLFGLGLIVTAFVRSMR